MDNELIPVSLIISELRKQKSHIFKVLEHLGIERVLQKSAKAKGQKVAFISVEDYERVKEYFAGTNNGKQEAIFDG